MILCVFSAHQQTEWLRLRALLMQHCGHRSGLPSSVRGGQPDLRLGAVQRGAEQEPVASVQRSPGE